MNLLAQLVWEFRLQKRYYFWATALVITVVWLLLLSSLNDDLKSQWMPALIFADLSNIGLLFIAGCLYLERRQGTLYALAITPFRRSRWLVLKLISLSVLTTLCALAIALFSGASVNWFLLVPAIIATALVFTLCGFLLALPFDDLLNYFLGMALTLTVLSLPLLDYFQVYPHWLYWLLPTQPVLQLLVGGFQPASAATISVSLLLCVVWIATLYFFAAKRFNRFVAMRPQQ
ncbi:MAG: hypothetical protein MI746_09975 [Pseudomonadales bacterium]|nr:hypothetical protein [Pseudomonadales bacterium]